ncbi:hypothetical protein HJFPF1_10455 [Paramyrothecium foliicola]|nr:hypothetical protein HJFPF1_10455 [Paramyrothecium foliicola]
MPALDLLPRLEMGPDASSADAAPGSLDWDRTKMVAIILPIIFLSLTITCFAILCIRMKRRRTRVIKEDTKIYPQPTYQRVYYSNTGYGYAQSTPDRYSPTEPRPPPQAYVGHDADVAPPSYQESGPRRDFSGLDTKTH